MRLEAVAGAAVGAAAMYALDRSVGRPRLAGLSVPAPRRRSHRAAGVAPVLQGAAARRRARFEAIDDATIARNVQRELVDEAPRVIVAADRGVVSLRGQVDDGEVIHRLAVQTLDVDGVHAVRSLLHTPDTPVPTGERAALLTAIDPA
ncbi:MAG TPA: BON domain-containing protein [Solirubrobacteraceae bacterium]|nr:BON domain-containing protein [Solirubrobacteraceae bacterium]